MSIAAALLMPTTQPPTGDGKPAASGEGDGFAALLDAALSGDTSGAVTPTPAATQAFSTLAPVLQLQDGLITEPAVTAAADDPSGTTSLPSTLAATVTTAAAATGDRPPAISTNATIPAPTVATDTAAAAAADLSVVATESPDATAPQIAVPDPVMPEPQATETATAATATLVIAAATTPAMKVAPAAKPGAASATTATDEDVKPSESSATGMPAAAAPGQTAAAMASPIAAIASPLPAAQVTAEATPVTAALATAPDAALPAEGSVAPEAETTVAAEPSANTNRAAPAASQAPAQAATAAAADTAAPKPDFASMVAAQAPDATSQSSATPPETTRAPTTPPALQSAPAATIQVYNRIVERADGRAQRFEIRLDPAELGRVDVRIEIGADKKVHAILAAHDSAALSDLMRGQRALERALTDAGLDLADKGVRFELASDNGSAASQQRNGEGNGRGAPANVWRRFDTAAMPATAETAAAVVQPSWRPQRLDLVA